MLTPMPSATRLMMRSKLSSCITGAISSPSVFHQERSCWPVLERSSIESQVCSCSHARRVFMDFPSVLKVSAKGAGASKVKSSANRWVIPSPRGRRRGGHSTPRSNSFASSAERISALLWEVMRQPICGSRRRFAWKKPGRCARPTVRDTPTRTSLRASTNSARRPCSTCSTSFTRRAASRKRNSPAGVRDTLRVVRSSKGTPRLASIPWSCRVIALCVSPTAAAALVKLRCFATRRKSES